MSSSRCSTWSGPPRSVTEHRRGHRSQKALRRNRPSPYSQVPVSVAANSVNAGAHTVSETAQPGYTGVIAGDCASNGSVTLALGQSKTCTITNDDDAPSLTLIKQVTNDNGGGSAATAWTLTATGTGGTPTNLSGNTPVASGSTFKADTYTLAESGPADYTASSWDCGSATMPTATTVTVGLGDDVTCTIINDDDEPSLTLIKQVTNDNGGTAGADDWTLTATGAGGSPTNLSGTTPVNSGAGFKADTYTLAESGGPSGYTAGAWDCGNATMPTATTVTVGLGDDATCTIINDDDAPSLTLIKQVINDDGGDAAATEWTLTATGTGGSPTNLSGTTPVASGAGFEADAYTLAESGGPSGYTAGAWNCGSATMPTASSVTVGLGDDVTCTIINNDEAGTLIVEKIVVGGTLDCDDFSFTVNGGGATSFAADCSNELTVDAGDYSVFEPIVTGWTTTYENSLNDDLDCTSLSIGNGESATCTITNTRQTGNLEVVKDLNPAADPGKFNLQIGGITDPDAANVGDGGSTGQQTLDTGTYAVGETAGTGTSLGNYASTIVCRADNGLGAIVVQGSGAGPLNVDVTNGSDIVCVITNTRVTVAIKKTNDEGDNAPVEPDETIHYTLEVTVNDGPATGVVVTDQLPTGLGNATNITDGGTYSAATNRITWNVGNLAQGVHTFEYDATVAANASGTLTNRGCVDADQNDALVCDETSLLVQNVVITKTNASSSTVVPGTAVDFTLALDVTNGPIDNVTIVDQLPTGIANATNISDGGTYSAATNRITWNLTNVADNETLTYKAAVSASATAGTLTNVATITDGPCVGGGCDDDSTVTVRVPTLVSDKVASTDTITISGPNDALVATPSVVTWTVSFTLANGPVTNAVIIDVIPTGFAYVVGSASNSGVFDQATNTVTWTFATLSTGGSVTFQTTVNPATISRTGPTVNTATIDSNETAPDTGQDSVTVVVNPPPLAGNPTPTPAALPNTATGFGLDGTPVSVPIELLAAFFIGSLGALTLASARTRSRRR